MFIIAALYHFTRLNNPAVLRAELQTIADRAEIRGSLLIAQEGINGTIAGSRSAIDAMLATLRAIPGCETLEHKESQAEFMPFGRMKVKQKREIVTMGQPDINPRTKVGNYVEPKDWNDLITGEDVVLIDTRNDYEVDIGTFKGAIDPRTKSFREFPDWWKQHAPTLQGKKVAMFCTGGIRCEKSTNFLLQQGVTDVFHLKGGILKYLEDVPQDQSLWEGECYVFDGRVSVGHGLIPGHYDTCHACRRPISDADKTNAAYEDGVSCPHCITQYSDADRLRFRERMKQMRLALQRGQRHLGANNA